MYKHNLIRGASLIVLMSTGLTAPVYANIQQTDNQSVNAAEAQTTQAQATNSLAAAALAAEERTREQLQSSAEPAGLLTNSSSITNDFNEPVTVDSRDQKIDGKARTSVFIDNVVITQGSLELTADRVEVNATAGKRKEIMMATGNPASYRQRKADGSWVEAKANEIIYSVESRTISLKGNASIAQNEIQVTGDSIVFDMAKEQILASTQDGSKDSVRTVISPGAFSDELNKPKSQENK
jgi:lipopolysaccharide export system protein LptA